MAFRVHSGTFLQGFQVLARCLPVFQQKGALSATSPNVECHFSTTWKEYPENSAYGSRNIPPPCEEGECTWRKILPKKQVKIAI